MGESNPSGKQESSAAVTELQPLTHSMTVAELATILDITKEPDGRKHIFLTKPLLGLTLGIKPQEFSDKENRIYNEFDSYWKNINEVDKSLSDETIRTAYHSGRNAYGATMIYIIREFLNQNPTQEVTLENLDSFSLTQQQVQTAALYALSAITHDFGKGKIEGNDENGEKIFYHQHMLTMPYPEKPSHEDFMRMQKHPQQGADMLKGIFDLYGGTDTLVAHTLITVAKDHHNKVIRNDETITAEVTVVNTAIDQYDTMTSRRNYQLKPPKSLNDAKDDETVKELFQNFRIDTSETDIEKAYYAYIDLCAAEEPVTV